jgi:hypothetical protein
MTIENTLERIATALEALLEVSAARNVLLENTPSAAAAAAAAEAVTKASTKGRGKKAADPEPVAAPETKVEPDPAASAETEKAEPEPAKTEPAAASVPPLAKIQARATQLAQKLGKEKVLPLIQQMNPTGGNLSSMTPEQQAGFWAALDALELGLSTDALS